MIIIYNDRGKKNGGYLLDVKSALFVVEHLRILAHKSLLIRHKTIKCLGLRRTTPTPMLDCTCITVLSAVVITRYSLSSVGHKPQYAVIHSVVVWCQPTLSKLLRFALDVLFVFSCT